MAGKRTGKKKQDGEVDEDLAVTAPNALLDHALGILFGFLVLRWLYEICTVGSIGMIFLVCLVCVIAFVKINRVFFFWLGCQLSQWRNKPSVPDHARNPLRVGGLQMKKWQDQAWQLTIHASMAVFEIYLLFKETWWSDMPNMLSRCDTAEYSMEVRVFYILQLAIWMWTGFSCKFLEERRKGVDHSYSYHTGVLEQ
jgi:hypothetical protein